MNHLTAEEIKYLKAWAIEEMHGLNGLAHQLQTAFGADRGHLAALFRVWAKREGLDPVAVTTLIESPLPQEPITWPWSTLSDT